MTDIFQRIEIIHQVAMTYSKNCNQDLLMVLKTISKHMDCRHSALEAAMGLEGTNWRYAVLSSGQTIRVVHTDFCRATYTDHIKNFLTCLNNFDSDERSAKLQYDEFRRASRDVCDVAKRGETWEQEDQVEREMKRRASTSTARSFVRSMAAKSTGGRTTSSSAMLKPGSLFGRTA